MDNPKPLGEKDDLDLIGKTINGYQVIEQVGKGGMAHVYKAYQPSLDRNVALKVLPPYYVQQDPSFMARFQREAKAVAKLRHKNILLVIDSGKADDIAYIVMEYVPAGTLQDRMKQKISLTEIYSIIGQVGSALDYAHSQGVIHRDIKPSNILMPEPDWALLTDFGLARIVVGDNTNITQSGMAVGTPAYMAPEQGQGLPVDHRSDIYSLGVMLYEMVVGEAPYTAETPMAVLVKHIVDPLPIISNTNPNIPDDLQRVILKSLAKSPEDRYQSAAELIQALNEVKDTHGDWLAPTVQGQALAPADTHKLSNISPADASTLLQPTKPVKKSFSWPFLGGFAGAMTALAIVAVVAVIAGLVAVSIFTKQSDKMKASAATETAEMVALLATTTPTNTPPPTATMPPTQTPLPTDVPTKTPPPGSGTLLFADDFSDEESGWDRFSDRDIITDYADGEYYFRMLSTEFLYWSNPYLYFEAVRIEVDAYLAEGSEQNGYGLICGYQDIDNFYVVTIMSDGFYEFWESRDGDFIRLAGDTENKQPSIRGGDGVNHIRLDCVNDTITLYVNEIYIDEVQAVITPGDVGLYTEGYADGPIEIHFDNFAVYQP